MYVEDDGSFLPSLSSLRASRLILAIIGHTAPIEREIRALSSALEAVKDEQKYILVRERLHRNSESSLLQSLK